MNSRVLVGIILNYFACVIEASFKIYWNVPSSMCSTKFGINVTKTLISNDVLVNSKEEFLGEKLVIFYENRLGKYPYIDPELGDVNGGLPQLGNLEEHLKVAEEDIQRIIANPKFDGVGIIDWEKWRPIWDFNWGKMRVYKKRTMELMKKKHPSWPWKRIENASRNEWEETTKQWMLKTLELTQKMRPEAKWCYYHFPDCYNYLGKDNPEQFFCSSLVRRHNDRLIWLWNATMALCPSIYYTEGQIKYNQTQQVWFLYGRLAEALRVSQPHMPVYPYINYRIHSSVEIVPKEHFWLMLAHSASLGLDGAIIWGSSNYVKTEEQCEGLQQYVDHVIAPASSTILSNANRCGETICNGNGMCTWPHQPYTSWKYLIIPNFSVFDRTAITCRCQQYKGRYCNVRDSNLTDIM